MSEGVGGVSGKTASSGSGPIRNPIGALSVALLAVVPQLAYLLYVLGSLVSLGGGSFRCRVGHGWTPDALMASHGRSLEQALWAALRVLEDNQALEDRMAVRASERRRDREKPPAVTEPELSKTSC